MRVQNYRCSESTIQQMALNNYWHFTSGQASSDLSSHPPMSQSGFPSQSDYSGTMSDHDTSTMDPSRMDSPSASLYSSADHSVASSDQHSSFEQHSTTPELGASDQYDGVSAPSYSDHSSTPGYGHASYESSLPYICMGKLCSPYLSFQVNKENRYLMQ